MKRREATKYPREIKIGNLNIELNRVDQEKGDAKYWRRAHLAEAPGAAPPPSPSVSFGLSL